MNDKSNGHALNKPSGAFNANAREFVPNPQAHEFVPTGGYNRQSSDIMARCGEVVDILEDVIGYAGGDVDYDGNLNDAELMEMLEMQEECRKEMMKTYVQANNPTIFEEIYYNVAYPDEAIIPQQATVMQPPQVPSQHHHHQQQETVINGIDGLNINEKIHFQELSALDQVKTNLNPDANEFVPKKYVETQP